MLKIQISYSCKYGYPMHEMKTLGQEMDNLPVLARFALHHKVIRDVWHFTFIISATVPALDQNHAKNIY